MTEGPAAHPSDGELRAVVDGLPALIAYVDRQERYRFNNKAYTTWFGLAPESIRGMTVREVIGGRAYAIIKPSIDAVLSGCSVMFRQQVPYSDRTRRIQACYIPHRGPEGTLRGFFDIVSQETDGTEHPHPAPPTPTAPAKPPMKAETATEILHEIIQPLTAITSLSGACLRQLPAKAHGAGDIAACLRGINEQAQRAQEILRRFRGLMGHGRMNLANIGVRDLVEGVVRLARADIEAHDVSVHLDLGSARVQVLADPILLEQALFNLLCNAIHALTLNGVRERIVRIQSKGDATNVTLRMEDTGLGIPEKIQDRLFEAFVTTKADGLGVGLAISRSIIEAHGGTLSAGKNPSGGSVFTLRLPRANASA